MKVKNIFPAGGMPTITYVDRSELELEDKLRKALAKGHAIIAITGPTKSGKTVLCRQVIDSNKSIIIEGGQIGSEREFWERARFDLNIPSDVEKGRVDATRGGFGVNVAIKGGIEEEVANSYISRYKSDNKSLVIHYCKENDVTIIIDDFHYLNPKIQKNIVRGLKGPVFDGLDVVLIAVPHRVFDVINAEKELEGRFRQIGIPIWEESDLHKIPEKGFAELNVSIDSSIIKDIAKECFGNPLLMQSFCAAICIGSDIYQKVESKTQIDEINIEEVYKEVAQDFGFPTFDKLVRGPQSRHPRNQRHYKDGRTGDIYRCIMDAIAKLGAEERIEYDTLRDALKELVSDLPQKHEVARALGHLDRIAHSMEGEPPLEWDGENDTLHLVDPFLRFYMKWKSDSRA